MCSLAAVDQAGFERVTADTAWVGLLLVLTATVTAVTAKEKYCYYCQYRYTAANSRAPVKEQCLDPFDGENIDREPCDGSCYVQQGHGQGDHKGVVRGCWTRSMGLGTPCTSRSNTKDGFTYSVKCCDEELCNAGQKTNMGIITLIVSFLTVICLGFFTR